MAVIRHGHQGPQTEESDVRETPRELFDQYNERFRFTLDVCATDQNALCEKYWTRNGCWAKPFVDGTPVLGRTVRLNDTEKLCGLTGSWKGERVWCNPPFSEIELWVYKAWKSEADLVVLLCPDDRTDRKWWHALVEPYRDGKDVGAWCARENPSIPRLDDKPSLYLLTENLEGRWNFTVNGGQRIVTKTGKNAGKPAGAMFGVTMLIWGQT